MVQYASQVFKGIHHRLVVTDPDLSRFESPPDPKLGSPGRYIHVRHCGGLPIVLLQLKDASSPIREEKGIHSR